ncbi:preprotein translocase subunit SecE [Lactococcus lactis]|uniref:Preprotein translocase subunit SecE n=1 Tax=Lactococcus lactis TaxID=1358 RepID=A0A9X4NIZ5_9LACT|nr:preprotein translocase subunit SecE [Lactococcus lactis]MDG4984584.1 preprotein translocase subunit SecE [Lactococcus lactis]
MFNYSKKIRKESEKINWLPFKQILKETLAVILVSILFALFLGGVNILLQQLLNHLLAK